MIKKKIKLQRVLTAENLHLTIGFENWLQFDWFNLRYYGFQFERTNHECHSQLKHVVFSSSIALRNEILIS
jgi:hypothetical protein